MPLFSHWRHGSGLQSHTSFNVVFACRFISSRLQFPFFISYSLSSVCPKNRSVAVWVLHLQRLSFFLSLTTSQSHRHDARPLQSVENPYRRPRLVAMFLHSRQSSPFPYQIKPSPAMGTARIYVCPFILSHVVCDLNTQYEGAFSQSLVRFKAWRMAVLIANRETRSNNFSIVILECLETTYVLGEAKNENA